MIFEESEYFSIKFDFPVIDEEIYPHGAPHGYDSAKVKDILMWLVKSILKSLDENPRLVTNAWAAIKSLGKKYPDPVENLILSVNFSQLGSDPRKKQITIEAYGRSFLITKQLFLHVEKKEKYPKFKSLQELSAFSVIAQLKDDIGVAKKEIPEPLRKMIKEMDDDWRPQGTRAKDDERVQSWINTCSLLRFYNQYGEVRDCENSPNKKAKKVDNREETVTDEIEYIGEVIDGKKFVNKKAKKVKQKGETETDEVEIISDNTVRDCSSYVKMASGGYRNRRSFTDWSLGRADDEGGDNDGLGEGGNRESVGEPKKDDGDPGVIVLD